MESNHVVHAPCPGMSPLSSVRMRKFQSDEGKDKFDPRSQMPDRSLHGFEHR